MGPFQLRAPGLADRLGLSAYPGFPGVGCGHDELGGAALREYAVARGAETDIGEALAAMIGGHHGVPRRPGDRVLALLDEWRPLRDALLDELAEHFGVADLSTLRAPGVEIVLMLAGLVNASDWIASDASRFPVTADTTRPSSAALAARAVDAAVWASRPVTGSAGFEELFGFVPNAMQTSVAAAFADTTGPSLVVIEARTGSGKTEAALGVVREALARGSRGFYIGLPTRATADQFHRRAARFAEAVWPDSALDLRLLHGAARLAGVPTSIPSAVGEEICADSPDAILARRWFDGARRGLLAPYAVGTIDQALQAVLSARFYPLRLLGLAGKVVIVDEAHAYDSYTGGLLESLVRWLGALQSTVVILSATLPHKTLRSLTAAFQQGVVPTNTPAAPSQAQYPRITIADAAGSRATTVRDDRPARSVQLDWLRLDDRPGGLVGHVADAVDAGGCVAVVCTTVALAQERYRALRETLAGDIPCLLLHSRIRPVERADVERQLVQLVGPGSARPERLVVVATQVIEQSLDLDFDVMFSDLAPVDLLIQRAGRVHRHPVEPRPARHGRPRLVIVDTPGAAISRGLGKPAYVYLESVLARTRLALARRTQFSEPDDLDELVEAVYADRRATTLGPDDEAQLCEWESIAARDIRVRADTATRNGIGHPVGPDEDEPWLRPLTLADGDDFPGDVRDNVAGTRWTDSPSVDVVVLAPQERRLQAVSSAGQLDPATVRDLLRRAVAVSAKSITAPITADPTAYQPAAWRRHGTLSHHALAVVGDTELPISWDAELGVITDLKGA